MGKIIVCLICLIGLIWFFSGKTLAVYDPLSVANNKFGIHILDTSEVQKASELVGTWGYVTIPIRANDRDLDKWTKFMQDCQKYKIIPLLRIASFPVGDHWMAPNEYDLVDFANFLNDLNWPIKNRYVIIYNESNHDGEWGGFVYPEEYARVLDRATDIFHKTNQDFFVIAGGMDASFGAYDYEQKMDKAWPGVFDRVDGLSYHAYGNPAFSSYPNAYSRVNVASYRFEYSFSEKKPIFITEAGWINHPWLKYAFENIWLEDNIVAITPFVLSAQAGPFEGFSFTDGNGKFKEFAREMQIMNKIAGKPQIADKIATSTELGVGSNNGDNINDFKLKIEVFWKKILDFIL